MDDEYLRNWPLSKSFTLSPFHGPNEPSWPPPPKKAHSLNKPSWPRSAFPGGGECGISPFLECGWIYQTFTQENWAPILQNLTFFTIAAAFFLLLNSDKPPNKSVPPYLRLNKPTQHVFFFIWYFFLRMKHPNKPPTADFFVEIQRFYASSIMISIHFFLLLLDWWGAMCLQTIWIVQKQRLHTFFSPLKRPRM